jgi:hypothetical protein
MIKRPGYGKAIEWIASNDDCYWLRSSSEPECGIMSVTACMVRDLYGVADGKVIKDLRAALAKVYPDHEALQ